MATPRLPLLQQTYIEAPGFAICKIAFCSNGAAPSEYTQSAHKTTSASLLKPSSSSQSNTRVSTPASFNDAVRALVAFVKKRDKRFAKRQLERARVAYQACKSASGRSHISVFCANAMSSRLRNQNNGPEKGSIRIRT